MSSFWFQQIRTFIQMRTNLKVVDNSGAKRVMCIQSLRGKKGARLGDMIIGSVKEAQPRGKVKKGDVVYGVVVRAAMKKGRSDGSEVQFDDNAIVIVNNKGELIGTRVFGPVPHELRKKKHLKIDQIHLIKSESPYCFDGLPTQSKVQIRCSAGQNTRHAHIAPAHGSLPHARIPFVPSSQAAAAAACPHTASPCGSRRLPRRGCRAHGEPPLRSLDCRPTVTHLLPSLLLHQPSPSPHHEQPPNDEQKGGGGG